MIRSLVRPPQIAGAGISLLAVFAMLGITALSGTKTGVALALAAALGPLAAYAAICRPFVFPYALFVVLVPFDNLLALDAFGTLTRLIAIASGGAILLWLIRTRRAIMPDRAIVYWALLTAWSAATVTWAIDPSASYAHLFTFCQLVGIYAVVSFVPIDSRMLRFTMAAAIVGGCLASGYGTYVFRQGLDIAGGDRLFLANDNSIIDPNQFAAALILPIALSMVGLIRARSTALRCGCGLALLIMGGGIAVSGSRGGLLGVAVALIYVIVRDRKRILGAFIGLAALSAALLFDSNVINRFSNAASTGGAGRVDIWRVGLSALRDHFWFGAGISNFSVAYDQSFLTVSEHYYTRWHRAPHNLLLSTSVELGIVGLVILLAAWYFQFRSMRSVPMYGELSGPRIGVEGALLGLFVAAMFLDVMYTKYIWLAFMLAMMVRNAAVAPARTQPQPCAINSYPIAAPTSPTTS
ncbi:MAG TPA: O-antigen ligase family protein [Candidatus Baltobacteraceae bacterium]|nr:O-antigen ligase family protein [Candidatus Baltobacteraceae bacterium]